MAAKVIGLTKNLLWFICLMLSFKLVRLRLILSIQSDSNLIVVCYYLFFNSIHICINYHAEGRI